MAKDQKNIVNRKPDLADAIARKKSNQPQRTDLWHLKLPNLDEGYYRGQGVPAMDKARAELHGLVGGGQGSAMFNMDDIRHRVSSVNVPFHNMEVEQAVENNSYWHYPKKDEISEVTFEIDEFEDAMSFRYLETWRKMMMRSDGTYYPPAIYKLPIILYRMPSTKDVNIVAHMYSGCFISAITEITSDYEATEMLKYNVTVTADRIDTKFFNGVQMMISDKERQILQNRIHFKSDDPANIREMFGGQVVSDAYDVFNNVIERVPGL